MSPYDKREAGAVWNALISPILVQSRKVLLCGKSLGRNQNMFNLFMIIFLIVSGFLLYGKGLSIPYYGNDFQFVFINPEVHNVLDSFFHPVPYTQTYRPIQAAIMQTVQALHGMNTVPIHLLSLLIHILIAVTIFKFMIRQNFSPIQSSIAAIFMVIAPINVMTVAGNDSLHQLLGTLFGILAVIILIRRQQSLSSKTPPVLMVAGSSLLFCMAIFSSETAIIYFVPILAVLMYQPIKNLKTMPTISTSNSVGKAPSGGLPRRGGGRVFIAIPFLLVLFIYGYIYRAIIPHMSGIWQSPVGFNSHTIINSLMISAGSIYPFSTVRLVQLFSDKMWPTIGILASTVVALIVIMAAGWLQSSKKSPLAGLMIVTAIMAMLLGLLIHPSESIVYTILPLVAVLIGATVGTMVERIRVIPSTRLLFGAFMIMMALACAGSTMQKVDNMKESAEQQRSIIEQLGKIVIKGSDQCIVLVNPRERTKPYSVFKPGYFDDLVWAQPFLVHSWNYQSPCSFSIYNEGDIPADASFLKDPDKHQLTLSHGKVIPWSD